MARFAHLVRTAQIDRSWVESELFPLADRLRERAPGNGELTGRSLYCLFYEPSFLTRTSFERAMTMLGGEAHHTEDASQFYPVRTASYVDNVIGMLASLHMDVVVLRSGDPGVVDRAAAADALPIINGGSLDDHPTQALSDIYTIRRELDRVDGVEVAVVGRMEHRNVSALLRGLALFDDVRVTLVPFSGRVDPEVVSYCEERGLTFQTTDDVEAVRQVDAIYLNGPRTVAHVQLLKSRDAFSLRVDEEFMASLRPHCVILDPMQRSGDFDFDVRDERLAFYRQAENALFLRMALLSGLFN